MLHIDIVDAVFRSPETEAAFFALFWRSLDALERDCASGGVRIAVENLIGASAEGWHRLYSALFDH